MQSEKKVCKVSQKKTAISSDTFPGWLLGEWWACFLYEQQVNNELNFIQRAFPYAIKILGNFPFLWTREGEEGDFLKEYLWL